MKVPYEKDCLICGDKIYGFSKKDCDWRFDMHTNKHRKEARDAEQLRLLHRDERMSTREDSINNNGGQN